MNSRIRSAILCLCLGGLVLPASATAGTVPVAPPGSGGDGAFSAAARSAANSGCSSMNVIAFRGTPNSRVRHGGRIRCENVRVKIRCNANLLRGADRISSLRSQGHKRCQVGMPFSAKRWPGGTPFTQNYRYKLTLKNRRLRWKGTTEDCPRRSNKRRTLTCRGSHTTTAPTKSVDRIKS